MNQDFTSKYYQEEKVKNQKERPWLYWLILVAATVVAVIAMFLA